MTIHFLTTEISVNAIGFDLLAISSEKSNFNRALLGIWKDKFDGEIIIPYREYGSDDIDHLLLTDNDLIAIAIEYKYQLYDILHLILNTS